jgi:hypothetical protein
VCAIYDPAKSNQRFSEIYDESKKIAEKKIKEKEIKLEEYELAEMASDGEIDLSIDEFEEEEEEAPLKFEKRKVGKVEVEESEELSSECPFCGEYSTDLVVHIQNCEFAPEDASINDIVPSKPKKKKKTTTGKTGTGKKTDTKKQKCPYCGKEFVRLGRHLNSCPKRPADAED